MTDVARAKYVRLMQEIEDLEGTLEELKARSTGQDLAEAQPLATALDEKRRELQRLSDGCGRPHHR
jgi:cell division septum initiation protein DivIVA